MHLFVAATHHAQVVINDAVAFLAKLGFELVLDGGKQRFFGKTRTLLHIGGAKERTLKGIALHTQLQVGVAGFFTRDLERIEEEHADLFVHDVFLRVYR